MRLINNDITLARPGIEEIVKQYPKTRETFYTRLIGEEMTTKLAFDRFKGISGFGDVLPVAEGTDIPISDIQTPFQRDFTVTARGLGYEVSAQAAYTDIYNEIKRPTTQLMDAMYDAREQSAANLLNLGFTAPGSGGTWTLDNVALFSASHPLASGVASNASALALGITNLETAVQSVMQVQDYMGKVWVGPKRWKLVVPTQLYILAKRLVNSVQLPTTNDNDPNVAGDHLTVEWNPYLTDTNNWFLIPSEQRHNMLFRINRMALKTRYYDIPYRPGDMAVTVHEEYGDGAKGWQAHFGANPS